jgi:hypothetical protein
LKYSPNTIISEIKTNNQPINSDLYKHYSEGLRKGINNTFFEDSGSGLSDIMRANVSRFAAYKAAHVTKALKSILNDNSMPEKERNAYAKKALKIFQNRQVTEQATAIARARTAKQFEGFTDEDSMRLFPNLRWLPSSAVAPRTSHMKFYFHIWAKTDPFWIKNSPGQEWNCQCDVEETADSETNNAAVPQPKPKKGLEGNPGIKEINGNPNPYYGQAFTDNASYINGRENSRQGREKTEAVGNLARSISKEKLKAMQGTEIPLKTPIGDIMAVFDSTTTSHLSNDIKEKNEWTWKEAINKLPELLKGKTPIGVEKNRKTDKKPWAVRYFYYKLKIGNTSLFIHVEENNIIPEARHFYRIYSMTKTVKINKKVVLSPSFEGTPAVRPHEL